MTLSIRILAMVSSAIVSISVIRLLIKHNMSESKSILWLIIGFFLLVVGFFPRLIDELAFLIGISYPPTLLFIISIILLMLIVFRSSIDLSKNDAKLNDIAITLSILKEENKILKEQLAQIMRNTYEIGSDEL